MGGWRALLWAACGWLVLLSVPLAAKEPVADDEPPLATRVPARSRSAIYHPPHTLRYDAERDDIIRQQSVFSYNRDVPGGPRAFYGNRLTEYRFIGPPGQGGIYDALVNEREERQLDPLKYRYRRRY